MSWASRCRRPSGSGRTVSGRSRPAARPGEGRRPTWTAALAGLLGGLLLGSPASAQEDLPSAVGELGPGIHAVLVVDGITGDRSAPTAAARVTAVLRLVSVEIDGRIASYQGELSFDPEAMDIVETTFPSGALGAWNVVAPGRYRFAGLVAEGLGGSTALTMVLSPKRALAPADFRGIVLEELTSAGAFENLTERVVEGLRVVG